MFNTAPAPFVSTFDPQRYSTEQIFFVYIYYDQNGDPFYVGKGKDARDTDHITACFAASTWNDCRRFYRKLRKHIRKGIPYSYRRVAEGLTELDALELEITYIARFGWGKTGPLTNLTAGGEGCSGLIHSEKTKRLLAEKIKAFIDNNPEAHQEQRAKAAEAQRTPEVRELRSQLAIKRMERPGEKEHLSKKTRAFIANNPEAWQEQIAKSAEACRKPAARKRNAKSKVAFFADNPEAKEHQSKKTLAFIANNPDAWQEQMAKSAEGHRTPAARKHQSKVQKVAQNRQEVIELKSQKTKEYRDALAPEEKQRQLDALREAKGPEWKQRQSDSQSASHASRVFGFKVTFHQFCLGYRSLTGKEFATTRKYTSRKAARELLTAYGRERVRVVLASRPAKPVTEQMEAA